MQLSGNINTFLPCLGAKKGDSCILDAFVVLACAFTIDRYRLENDDRESWQFFVRGSEFSFTNDVLDAFFFYIQPRDGYARYPFLRDFIVGLDYTINHDGIARLLGTPERTGIHDHGSYIRYRLGDHYLHFEFDHERALSLVTLFTPD